MFLGCRVTAVWKIIIFGNGVLIPPRSLYLEDSVKGARDAIIGGFAMGIRISKFDVEKSLEDFRATLERIKMATTWDEETISSWEEKGEECLY